MWVTWDRLMVFSVSGYSGFLHQLNWLPQYNWNIVQSGIKHHPRWKQTVAGQIGPMLYIVCIKLNGKTDIWLCSFSLMLRACWSLWFDTSYWKMILCLSLVAKARVPSVILSSWSAVLSGQIDVSYPMSINHWPLAMMNFRECFKVNF